MSGEVPAKAARWQAIDIARGLALCAMVVFHLAWDLYYFGISGIDPTEAPGWVAFQKTILSSFLLLAGASLVLAHGSRIRWPKFWRREAILVLAALLVSAGTWWMFPDYFVFFGVLHAIALFSLIALPFLRWPGWVAILAGAAVIVGSMLWHDPMFEDRTLAWIGFWPTSPPTADVVPIFPWLGVLLLGLGALRMLLASPAGPRLAAARSDEPLAKGVAFLGRWSLPFYVVHQPIVIGILWGLIQLQSPALTPPVPQRSADFTQSCVASCTATGGEAGTCQRYCGCALEQVDAANLWAAIDAASQGGPASPDLSRLAALCQAMAK